MKYLALILKYSISIIINSVLLRKFIHISEGNTMNEYSKGTQIVAVIVAEIISYILMIFFNQYSDFLAVIPFPDLLMAILAFLIIPLLFIICPILFVYIKYKCKPSYLLLCMPIIFICTFIYLPDGIYFLINKGPFSIGQIYDYSYEKPWVYARDITIEFFIVQLIPVSIVRGIKTSSKPDSDEQKEQTDKNN